MLRIPLGLVLACVCCAGSAKAAQIEVTYALSAERRLIGFDVPVGPVGVGQMTRRYAASGPAPGVIVPGPVTVVTFSLYQQFSFNDPVYGPLVSGYQRSLFPGPGTGTYTPGGTVITFGADTHFVSVHCNGAVACASLFAGRGITGRTESVPAMYSTFFPGTQGYAWGSPAAPRFYAGIAGAVLGWPFKVTITGTEVSRTYVPEPPAGAFYGVGLLMLAAAALRRAVRSTGP